MGAKNRDGAVGIVGPDEGDEPAFVGDVERIEPEDLAGGGDGFADRDLAFVDRDREAARLGDLDQAAGEAAAGQVPEAMHIDAGIEERQDRRGHGGAVAGDRRLEAEALARRHDGDAVASDIAGENDDIAGPDRLRLDGRRARRRSRRRRW